MKPGTIPFKLMLRRVVARLISSARTETDRVRFYRRFWIDIKRNVEREHADFLGLAVTPAPEDEVTAAVAGRIAQQRRDGFTRDELAKLFRRFKRWSKSMRSNRGQTAARVRWDKAKQVPLGDSKKRRIRHQAAANPHLASRRTPKVGTKHPRASS